MSPDAPASSRPNGGRSAHRAEGVLRGSSMKGAVERRASTIAQEAARRARNTSDPPAASCELRRKRGRRALRPIEARWSSQYAPWRRRGFAAAGGYSTVLPKPRRRCSLLASWPPRMRVRRWPVRRPANTYFRATARRATPAAIISSVRTRFLFFERHFHRVFNAHILLFCIAHSVG